MPAALLSSRIATRWTSHTARHTRIALTASSAAAQILHARGAARDQLRGDSPIHDIREAIGLDIAAERMGASIFGNSALPSIVFKHGPGSKGFETDEQEKAFIESFQQAYTRRGRFRALVVPPGLDLDQIGVDNEKAQFLATRQYQRTVIAGAFGVPPHMVGDLSRGTFNNVEQQSLDFVISGRPALCADLRSRDGARLTHR